MPLRTKKDCVNSIRLLVYLIRKELLDKESFSTVMEHCEAYDRLEKPDIELFVS